VFGKKFKICFGFGFRYSQLTEAENGTTGAEQSAGFGSTP
jgi:hypothetical protein